MKENTHDQNQQANQNLTRLIFEGKSDFEIEVASMINDLTRQVS